jgi:hypothetical protein
VLRYFSGNPAVMFCLTTVNDAPESIVTRRNLSPICPAHASCVMTPIHYF